MNDFIKEGVKVGDELYSLIRGWGKVSRILQNFSFCMILQYKDGYADAINKNGKITDGGKQVVFWDEPKFEIPKKPKQEVVKEIDVFVNYNTAHIDCTDAFVSEKRADFHQSDKDIRVKGKLTFTILE